MKKRYKRGAVIVESAIIYPIIILTAGILVSITLSLYVMTEKRVNCDAALRAESGKITKTIVSFEAEKNVPMENAYKVEGSVGLYQEIAIAYEAEYGWSLLTAKRILKNEISYFTLHDECRFIRNADLISDGISLGIENIFGGED